MSKHTLLPVQLSSEAIRINGRSEIFLCASLFYFRIPRAYWRQRMEQLKAYGYNAIDVYFPWNHHEREEGAWDFAGERDAEAFLQAANDAGLWVVARPGPYICSEWDGGGLPAYLLAREGVRLRDNDPEYLRCVSAWFDRILPILAKYQTGGSGTVIGVQLENELDFYDCADPHGYIAALRDMALGHGIRVPLIACAGQGGLFEASGFADGVTPTCNFYPNDRDPVFEEKVLHYREALAERDVPLMVTETNRAHYLLRRLLSCGAKLLGPYLQVSGTDFGFATSINNWGSPLAFMSTDYDFGGMITPEGHIRTEAFEGRLLGGLIRAYGSALAEALPVAGANAVAAPSSPDAHIIGPFALALAGGGKLLTVSNAGDRDAEVALSCAGASLPPLLLKEGRSLALPLGVPLAVWQLPGTLLHATAELFLQRTIGAVTVLAFHAESDAELAFRFDEDVRVEPGDAHVRRDGSVVKLAVRGGMTAPAVVEFPDGRQLRLICMARSDALLVRDIDAAGRIESDRPPAYATEPADSPVGWSVAPADAAAPPADADATIRTARPEPLERHGIYRGFAWYAAAAAAPAGASRAGILVRRAADVVSVYADGVYAGTVTPGGGSRYLPLAGAAGDTLNARVEIWGHTNFDDARLPSLRLNGLKGIGGLVAVTAVRDLTQNWRVRRARSRELAAVCTAAAYDDGDWPIVSFGGWLSPDDPSFEYYRKTFAASASADSWTLCFEGMQATARVFVNGSEAGTVHPFDPYLDATPFVRPGEPTQLTVFLERMLGRPAGKVKLYEGYAAADCRIDGSGEEALWRRSRKLAPQAEAVSLPVRLQPGAASWLLGAVNNSAGGSGWRVHADGVDMKLTVWLNGRIVGRLWLGGESERPTVRGGSDRSFYLPGAWLGESGGELAILLEAVAQNRPSRLDSLAFVPV